MQDKLVNGPYCSYALLRPAVLGNYSKLMDLALQGWKCKCLGRADCTVDRIHYGCRAGRASDCACPLLKRPARSSSFSPDFWICWISWGSALLSSNDTNYDDR